MNTILIKLVKVCITICLMVALSLWLAGCNHVDQAANPTPTPNPPAGVLKLVTDSNNVVAIPLSELGISHRAPFTLNPSGFRYGEVVLSTDNALAYKSTSLENWPADSGVIQVCQGGECVSRHLVVQNSGYDTLRVTATCTSLSTVRVVEVAARSGFHLLGLDGLEPGAKIDSVWGFYHTAIIDPDSLGLNYYAVNGPATGIYLGFDQLYYRVTLPGGAGCKTGFVRFIIPDTCSQPNAHRDVITGSGNEITILHSELYANDVSCDGSKVPEDPILKLRFQGYALPYRQETKWGMITDTLLNGTVPAFKYRLLNPAAHGDTLLYYMQDQYDDRISVTDLIIHLN